MEQDCYASLRFHASRFSVVRDLCVVEDCLMAVV
jgi:hypothetical protein